jgi:peptide deformylase
VTQHGFHLRLYPHPLLRQKAEAIGRHDPDGEMLFSGMADTLQACNGIGLAATQLGVMKQAIAIDLGEEMFFLTNPRIVERRGETEIMEGCLSMPEVRATVKRSEFIVVKGFDVDGKQVEREFSGLEARVVQHACDHLNGVLIIDYERCPGNGSNRKSE